MIGDMVLDIPEDVVYSGCSVGDPRGKLICRYKMKNGVRLTKIFRWDGISSTEADALIEAKKFIASNTKFNL